jgi:hypothetical protein
LTKQNKKTNQTSHGYGVKTYFVKNGTHPGAADCQKCSQNKMSSNRGGIRQISENVTRPEIKKHGNDESNEAILTIFQGKTLYKFESPGKKQADSREKYGEQNHAEHPQVPGVRIYALKYCRMYINQKGENIRTDQQWMKQDRKKMRKEPNCRGWMFFDGRSL